MPTFSELAKQVRDYERRAPNSSPEQIPQKVYEERQLVGVSPPEFSEMPYSEAASEIRKAEKIAAQRHYVEKLYGQKGEAPRLGIGRPVSEIISHTAKEVAPAKGLLWILTGRRAEKEKGDKQKSPVEKPEKPGPEMGAEKKKPEQAPKKEEIKKPEEKKAEPMAQTMKTEEMRNGEKGQEPAKKEQKTEEIRKYGEEIKMPARPEEKKAPVAQTQKQEEIKNAWAGAVPFGLSLEKNAGQPKPPQVDRKTGQAESVGPARPVAGAQKKPEEKIKEEDGASGQEGMDYETMRLKMKSGITSAKETLERMSKRRKAEGDDEEGPLEKLKRYREEKGD